MAFMMSQGTGRRRRQTLGSMSEINVVPLVDVVLVLLIIFMLTAQVMEFGLEIDVPKVKQERASAEDLPVISLTDTGGLYLNDAKIEHIDDLRETVIKRFGANTKAVYVKADKNVTWDQLAQVVEAVGSAKFEVRMVTKPDEGVRGRR